MAPPVVNMVRRGLENIIINGRMWLEGYIRMKSQGVAVTDLVPPDGMLHFYAKTDSGITKLFFRSDDGLEYELVAGGSIITDHGALSGLADDDHTQYVLRSILTTNGDLFTRLAGVIARRAIGTEGDILTVVSGVPNWQAPVIPEDSGRSEILVADGECAPPVMLTSEDECDFLYSELI